MVYDDTFNAEFYKSLSLFRMNLKMRLAAGATGGRKSNAKGSSVEFSDFREYLPGDDIRRIDWNAYARFDRLFVKLFMEEKEGLFRIYLDGSASMNYGEKSKTVLAKQIAAALSYCILDHSDRVILNFLKKNKCETFKGVTGKQGFSKITDNLSSMQPEGENDLLKSICSQDIKLRGMSIVISDFYTEHLEDVIKYLAHKKQEIFLIQILSPEELHPELTGTFSLIDSETGRSLKVTGSSSLEKDYASAKDRFLRNIESLCKKYGAKYILANTEDSYETVLRG